MGKFKLPQLTTAQRVGLTLDAREIVYDTDLEELFYGDGSTIGGLTLIGPQGTQGIQGIPGEGLEAVVDDTAPRLGGFLDPNDHYIGMDKGCDIESASPLPICTDGDYFDVTGTVGFTSMMVTANRFFILQFDSMLTIIHGASIILPGVENFTTNAGDQLLCFSPEANVVRVVNITKTDGTAIANDALFNIIEDDSPQLGGFLDPDGHYIGSDKGSDIASASPLVIDTDGDHFDVTGTTGFSSMTVVANRVFTLQFDSALTITDGAPITIPGGENFTTSAGDIIQFQSVASNVVRIISITKADGTAVSVVPVTGIDSVVEDTSPQLGGFLDPNGHYIGSDKGGNIASVSPLVINTDGDYFDITGTTGFSSITVVTNRSFTLRFNGVLTIVVGSGITLNNGGGNFTTSAGDVIQFQSVDVNSVVGWITKADGTALVSAPSDLVNDTTPQLGGFLDPNGHYIGSAKGGNISSASPLVIDTDGDYFQLLGTTDFSSITVAAHRSFTLRIGATLTIIVDSGITLNNGGENFTASIGDIIQFQSVNTNSVVGWITRADGKPVAAAAGGLIDIQTFLSSGTWTKPVGTAKVNVTAGGAGGEGGTGAGGGNGGTESSFGSFCTGGGGSGGGAGSGGGLPGIGTDGDLNIKGGLDGSSYFSGDGGPPVLGGGGGGNGGGNGGGGGTAIKFISSGLGLTETITVGSGGSGAGIGEDGADGYVRVESYA